MQAGTWYLESFRNRENRPDARFLRVVVFCNEEVLENMEGAVEEVEVAEWRCLRLAGK
jgi:hypothetical protein